MQGEIVSVKPHSARKNLLLPQLAVYASPDNIKHYQYLKTLDSIELPSSKYARKVGENFYTILN